MRGRYTYLVGVLVLIVALFGACYPFQGSPIQLLTPVPTTPLPPEKVQKAIQTILGAPAAPAEETGVTATVKVPSLRVRKEASTEAPVIAGLREGDVVAVIGRVESGAWYQIQVPDVDTTGFVAAEFVEVSGDLERVPLVTETGEPVTARELPSAEEAMAEATPTEEAMAEATPTEEAVAEATPTPEATPTEEAMAEATPTEEAMAEATPTEEAVAEATPTPEATPTEETMAEATPTEEAMAEATPTEEAVAEATPTPEATPTEETMAEATPTEEAMAEATPTEEAVAEATPTPEATPMAVGGGVQFNGTPVDKLAAVAVRSLRVRIAPSTERRVIAGAREGEVYPVAEQTEDGTWTAIYLPGYDQVGWVRSDCIRILETDAVVQLGTATVNTGGPRLRVRSAPSLDAPIVGHVYHGQRYATVAMTPDGKWVLLLGTGLPGPTWVSADYVVLGPPAPPDP